MVYGIVAVPRAVSAVYQNKRRPQAAAAAAAGAGGGGGGAAAAAAAAANNEALKCGKSAGRRKMHLV